jgi:hypothetical protein
VVSEDDIEAEDTSSESLSDQLVQQARKYVNECRYPIQLAKNALAQGADGFMKKIELGIPPEKGIGKEALEHCTEALETILHHRYLLFTKLSRAVSSTGRAEGGDDPFAEEDAVRSAGVALKAVRQSIDGWVTLHDRLSLPTAGLLEMLLLLDRLRRGMEERFPEAAVEGERG